MRRAADTADTQISRDSSISHVTNSSFNPEGISPWVSVSPVCDTLALSLSWRLPNRLGPQPGVLLASKNSRFINTTMSMFTISKFYRGCLGFIRDAFVIISIIGCNFSIFIKKLLFDFFTSTLFSNTLTYSSLILSISFTENFLRFFFCNDSFCV